MNEEIRNLNKVIRKENCQFYTDTDAIYKLKHHSQINLNGTVLEPAAGDGAFIEVFQLDNCKTDLIDIDKSSSIYLKKTFPNTNVYNVDFLEFNKDYSKKYDLVFGNPPFNVKLKNKIKGISNSTDAFLYHSLNMLEDNGQLLMVVPGTVFRNKKFEFIRDFIFQNYKILSIYDLTSYDFMGASFEIYAIHIINQKNSLKKLTYSFFDKQWNEHTIENSLNSKRVIKLYNDSLGNIFEKKIGKIFEIKRGRDISKSSLKGRDISIYVNGWKKEGSSYPNNQIICLQNIAYRIIAAYNVNPGSTDCSETITVLRSKDCLTDLDMILITSYLNSSIANYFIHVHHLNYSRLTIHMDKYYLEDLPIFDIRKITETKKKELKGIVDFYNKSRERLNKINDFFYKLFSFNQGQIDLVESKWTAPELRGRKHEIR